MRKKVIPRPTLGINITSLCDIMLALLIFFMLVSKKGIDTGADKELALPVAFMGVDMKDILADIGHSVVLNVYPGLGDEPRVNTLLAGRRVEMRTAERGPGESLIEFLEIARRASPEVQVVLYADEDLDYRYLEKVLIACATAQIRSVSFATRRAPPEIAGTG